MIAVILIHSSFKECIFSNDSNCVFFDCEAKHTIRTWNAHYCDKFSFCSCSFTWFVMLTTHKRKSNLKLVDVNGSELDDNFPFTRQMLFNFFVCHYSDPNQVNHTDSDTSCDLMTNVIEDSGLHRNQMPEVLERSVTQTEWYTRWTSCRTRVDECFFIENSHLNG